MDVGPAGGTTIERTEPPRRVPDHLLPDAPAPRPVPSLRRISAWAAVCLAMLALVLSAALSLGDNGPAKTRDAIEGRSEQTAVDISRLERSP